MRDRTRDSQTKILAQPLIKYLCARGMCPLRSQLFRSAREGGLKGANLEDCDIVRRVARSPLVEALAPLDDDKRGEHVSVRRATLVGCVVLDGKGRRHHGLQLWLHVQLPLPVEGRLVEVELNGCLQDHLRLHTFLSLPWRCQAFIAVSV